MRDRARTARPSGRRTSARSARVEVARRAQRMTSAPLFGLSDQLVAIEAQLVARRRAHARPAAWKTAGSGAFADHDRLARARARARGASRGCTGTGATVASASSRLSFGDPPRRCRRRSRGRRRSARRRGAPSGSPARAKRRSRLKSKLNELKRQTGVPPRDAVDLDVEPAALEAPPTSAREELVAAAGRRRSELVEDGEIRATVSRSKPSSLRAG